MRRLIWLFTVVALAATLACSRAPLHVRTIQVGRTLNSDHSVGTITTQFKPTDTIYVAVLTDASGRSAITARWTYAGRPVSEETKNVSYQGEAATEFHIQNSGGFPEGDYKVELLVDGQPVGERDFKVAK
jgi:hypothetical protein